MGKGRKVQQLVRGGGIRLMQKIQIKMWAAEVCDSADWHQADRQVDKKPKLTVFVEALPTPRPGERDTRGPALPPQRGRARVSEGSMVQIERESFRDVIGRTECLCSSL